MINPKLRFPEFNDNWLEKPLGSLLGYEQPTKYLVRSTEYNDRYSTPVLTAGKTFILGYTNEEDNIYENNLPVIIFDDFTTASKYVDFPFKAKSSAMKILRANDGNNIKILYEVLTNLKYEIGGHERHWISKFSSIVVKLPGEAEQQKIANFLTAVDNHIELISKKVDLLKQYKKGVMQKIFNQQIRFKDENGNSYPNWSQKKVEDIFTITRGDVLAAPMTKQTIDGSYIYPVYSSQTKQGGLMGYYDQYLYKDAITWTTDGANAGDVSFRKGEFYCTNVCGVLLNDEGYANNMVAEMIARVSKTYVSYVGNPKLMNNVMAKIKVTLPKSTKEQQKIADFLTALDDNINLVEKGSNQAKQLKKALLQRMFV